MAATAGEISIFLSNIRNSYMDYGFELSKYQRIGVEELECAKFRFRLVTHLIKAIVYYFIETDYENDNSLTKIEAKNMMQHANNILNCDYMLSL